MNLAEFRATSRPVKSDVAAVIEVPADAYVRDGWTGPGSVGTAAYLRMCVNTDFAPVDGHIYVLVLDAADIPAARAAAAAMGA